MALNVERQGSGVRIAEMGKDADGNAVMLDRRLYVQFFAFGACQSPQSVIDALDEADVTAAVYADANDPFGIGIAVCHEDPDFFVDTLRQLLTGDGFRGLQPKSDMTMFGRTYSIGYEQNLANALINRPASKITDTNQPWAIWYPLRRKGDFEALSAGEQRTILMEHGGIGRAYGEAGHGTDIRLACHGLDKHDNDFVIALIGKALTPLSKIIERMRKTKQTSQYLASLGPFFVGKAIWQKNTIR